jgi:hypothetical protein
MRMLRRLRTCAALVAVLALRRRRACAALAAVLALLAGLSPPPRAHAADAYSEDEVKAAYLYRFAGYVEWADESPERPFDIAVLGAPDVAAQLRRLLPTHKINGRSAQVREITGAAELGAAQIVYAGRGRAEFARAMLRTAHLSSLLFVTDQEGGLEAGSAVNFITIDRRVRFEVSLAAADRSGIKISSELLGVAVRVQGVGKQSRECCAPPMMPAPLDDLTELKVARRIDRHGSARDVVRARGLGTG